MVCNQAFQNEQFLQLVAEVERLKAELAMTKELLAKERQLCDNYPTVSTSDSEGEQQQESSHLLEGNSNRWSSVVKRKTKSTSAPKSGGNSVTERASVSADDCKFNVIMYGIEECKKGTPRHVWMNNDTKSTSETIQEVCPDNTCQAIRHCVRLGRYTEGRNQPLLVKLNRSCDALSILANRHKLLQSSTPVVFTKPHQWPHERSTEATLLCQRKLLIESGTDKKDIRIRGNSIFIKKKKCGSASASLSSFMLLSVSWPTTISQTQPKLMITQEIRNPICLLLLKALSPLMIITLPTMSRPMPPIDFSILITVQVLHTKIQFALTIRTIQLHAAISMLEALSANSDLLF